MFGEYLHKINDKKGGNFRGRRHVAYKASEKPFGSKVQLAIYQQILALSHKRAMH
jgi:hypothetical protein